MPEPKPCPCCNNPWSRGAESFMLSCESCVDDDKGVSGLDPANMDPSISPAGNFFKYANGKWMETHPIPAEYP